MTTPRPEPGDMIASYLRLLIHRTGGFPNMDAVETELAYLAASVNAAAVQNSRVEALTNRIDQLLEQIEEQQELIERLVHARKD